MDVRVASAAHSGPDPVMAADAAADALDLGGPADLLVAFLGADLEDAAAVVAARLRARLSPRHLLGVVSRGVIAGGHELDPQRSLALWAARLPQAHLTPLRLPAPALGSGGPWSGWQQPPSGSKALLLFGDPYSFPARAFLEWAQATGDLPIAGGLANVRAPGRTRLLLDEQAYRDGAVAIALGGDVAIRCLVSQGCRPIGTPYVVTRARGRLVEELASAPASQRIRETFHAAAPADRGLMQAGLHIGVAVDEYRDEFHRGDFVVRGVLRAHGRDGAIEVGDVIDPGRTVQFQVRDAASADEDLRSLLARFTADAVPAGALAIVCRGRGARLFGEAGHDARILGQALAGRPVAGFLSAGEFGPVGGRSYLHGFTVTVAALDARPARPAHALPARFAAADRAAQAGAPAHRR